VNAGPTIFSFRNWIEDAYATFTVPECFVLPDVDVLGELEELEELEELLQAAAASPMHVMIISALTPALRFFPGIATIVRP
jgi:hypothetical protein